MGTRGAAAKKQQEEAASAALTPETVQSLNTLAGLAPTLLKLVPQPGNSQPEAVSAVPTLEDVLAPVVPLLFKEDGSFDAAKLMGGIKKAVGDDEKFSKVEKGLLDYYSPEGVIDMSFATWDMGIEGKVHTGACVAGYGAIVIAGCEIAGRWLDIPSIQFATRLARVILGD
jgi:hypothetical protein